ncbi:peptidase [Streptomyces sp. NPDC002742]|jgi:uncharacterized protein YraI|uniref:peptidase n=1 Tax=unclassified Streptomyces TaxID=2593676 RepID=UPI00342DB33E
MALEDIAVTDSAEAADVEPLTAQALRTYPLAPGHNVNVRSGPGTHFSIVRTLAAGSRVPISCQCSGEAVAGPYGTSRIWDNISNGQFVSDAYVQTGSDGYVAPTCS